MDVIKKYIYVDEYKSEYLVALPPVLKVGTFYNPNNLPDKAQIVVAVYRPSGRRYGSSFDFSHEYEFVGVEVR